MTSATVFAGLGLLIYVGLTYAEAAFTDLGGAFFAVLWNLVATVFLFTACHLRKRSSDERIYQEPADQAARAPQYLSSVRYL